MSTGFFGERGGFFDFFFCKEAGFDNDLYNSRLGSFYHSLDIFSYIVIVLVLHGADLDDHIDFLSTVRNSLLCFKSLRLCRHRSQRKAHYTAGFHRRSGKSLRNERNIRSVYANRGKAVRLSFLTVAENTVFPCLRL